MNATDNSSPGAMFPSNPALKNETRVPLILAVLITFGALSTIAVVLRIYTRIRLLKIFELHDALIVVAQILTIGLMVVVGLEVKYGLGKHIWTLPMDNMIPSLKLFYSNVILYILALNIVKLSILFQIRRIFVSERIQLVTLIGIIIISLWTITSFFFAAFICIPVTSFWNLSISGKCLSFEKVYYTMAVINIITDFAIFSIPLPVIKTLILPRRQKIILIFIFSLGFFSCCVSIIRLKTLTIGATSQDPSWDEVAVTNWTFIELATAIITACLSTLRPLVSKFIPSLLGSMLSTKFGSQFSQSVVQSQIKTNAIIDTVVGDDYNADYLQKDIVSTTSNNNLMNQIQSQV